MGDLKTGRILAEKTAFAVIADLAIADPAGHLAQHHPILGAAEDGAGKDRAP
jgi:hypothetical protein